MATSTTMNYPQLQQDNFSNWKFRVECLLEEKGVKDIIKNEVTDEALNNMNDQTRSNYTKNDAKAKAIIVHCITDKHLNYIKDCKTSFEMMKILSDIFQRKSTLSKLYIRRKLLTLKCEEKTDLQDHFLQFDNLIRELESTGSKMDETDKVCHLLLTMNEKYNTVITALETTTMTLNLDFVKSKLLDVELKLKNEKGNQEKEDECSFNAGKNLCYTCGSPKHYQAQCPKNQASGSFNRGRGSPRRNYRGRTYRGQSYRGRNSRGWNYEKKANVAEDKEKSEEEKADVTLAAMTAEIHSREKDHINFILDSGATNHLVRKDMEDLMTDIKEINPVYIKVANGENMLANKRGILRVKAENTNMNVSIDALIVENLSHNLLSVRKVNDAGYKVVFYKGCASIIINREVITCRSMRNLFVASFKIKEAEMCNLSKEEEKTIWHLRLGHINRRGLQILGLPYSDKACDSCMKGKATRNQFEMKTTPRSSRIGELLHCDVWGPFNIETINGEKYFLSITDDYSHFTFVYLMKNKSETEEKLIEHIQQLRSDGRRVSRIRTDNGTEFTTNKLKNYYLRSGIRHERTAKYTPQQNGVSERLNRTLTDKVRTMLIDTGLPKFLWGEALRCAVYQLNRSPSRAVNGKVPAKIYQNKVNLNKLKVFGSKAWVYILPKRGKLEPRAEEMRMVAYSGAGYRLWDPRNNEIVISRDVRFDETNYNFKEEKEEKNDKKQEERRYVDEEKENGQNRDEETTGIETEEDEEHENITNRRNTKLPSRFNDYEMYYAYCSLTKSEGFTPETYEEAIQKSDWKEAIQKELDAHEKQQTWEEVKQPKENVKIIDTKWVFRIKEDGTKKARVVARGFQIQAENQMQLYSPVARMTTIRTLLIVALQNNWKIKQMDIPAAFLNGEIESNVYIYPPKGLNTKSSVLKLNRALYGLKESPKLWNNRLNKFIIKNNFKRSNYDCCLYYNREVWMIVYVDDLLLTGKEKDVEATATLLVEEFEAKDIGEVRHFLGMKIERTKETLNITQTDCILKLLKLFKMDECKGLATPMEENFQINPEENQINVPYRQLIGSLMYISLTSRPDITFAVSYLSRWLDKPNEQTWKAGKRILRYLQTTKNMGLVYKIRNTNIEAFSDADWGSDKSDRKSISGAILFYGGNPIHWTSKKQGCVALSTAEAEYIAASAAAQELINVKGVLSEFGINECAKLYCDNKSAILISTNYENTKRSKHIDIKYHYLKDLTQNKIITLEYVSTNENIADILTKPLGKIKFEKFREKANVM